ncbi:arginine--tRNA ligase [Candidatus Peregrinibacteria bacterium]|nr:arginine--tRNA ligase [Candidatus Peregrinibacteria bacterium]
MQLIIDRKIFDEYHDLKIGAIIIRGFNNSKRSSAIESLLRGVCAQRRREFQDKDIHENPMIKVWDQTYGRFGVNPKKFPPSISALLKRIRTGKYLSHINPLVDLYNYFSLKYLLPIGGEDIDWLCGDLRLAFTKGGEAFRPIGSIEVETAKEGEIAYMDKGGITSQYWNYHECERTKFTERTTNAVILIEDLSKMHMDEFGRILDDLQNNILKYIGGQIESYLLNEENPAIELGAQGRTHADDAKIPQQERAHFLEQELRAERAVSPASASSNSKKKPWNSSGSSKQLIVEDKTSIRSKIGSLFVKALGQIAPGLKPEIRLENPASVEHGDYSSNIAMQIAKFLKKSPRDIAQEIIRNITKNTLIEKVTVEGPGFINIFISEKILNKEINSIIKKDGSYGSSKIGHDKTVIIEYSQPNIAKPLGVHHLLSTIIGQSIYNLLKLLGFKAVSINHIGDWGTQFGKLIHAYKQWGDKKTVEKNPISELLKLYVRFHNEAEKDQSLEDKGREEFKKFEEGDSGSRKLWQWFVDESMKEVEKTYGMLGGIHFDYVQGESFYEDKMGAIFEEGKKRGIFVKGEEGAYVSVFDDPDIPTVPVRKKDGATLYITRDFAALKYRIDTWHPEKILYVVDVAQILHFKQIFATARKFPWYGGEGEHVVFGRMQFKDGKMSTRKGNIIALDEVLSEAINRALKIVWGKNPDLKNKDEIARLIGIGAVKYNILSQNRISDITFDWDKMLSLEGNSAPYLQYTYARARSILRKSEEKNLRESVADDDSAQGFPQTKIRNLTVHLSKFSEYIVLAASEYKPNIIANYLYDLAQKFNSFYNSVPVLRAASAADRKQRLKIVKASSIVMKNGLGLLGIETVEEM